MTDIIMRGLGTAVPPLYATQAEAFEFFDAHFTLTESERSLYKRILLDGQIKGRHLGMDAKADVLETNPDRLLARYEKYARSTATQAARAALADAGASAADVTGLVVNTCTGYLCPGLSSYIAQDLNLSPTVDFLDMMGMGCGAAVPNLAAGTGMLALRGGLVLSVAVEICTATIFPSHEPGLVVSNCIFSDGAAAALLGCNVNAAPRNARGAPLMRMVDFATALHPEHREELRYHTVGGLLRNHLTRRVPVLGATSAKEIAQRLLARNGLQQSDIKWWAVHPGGTQVLDQVGRHLGLSREALRFSYDVFENYGNMSSPSVLFVLRAMLDSSAPPRHGERGMLLTFGAGFSAFGALVEF
ncbi:3-oxoacyl-ACP synthase [candidate division BRC1 bacterium HGW-BRC1-1]|nr:MAG: 3-oxoacyl-ACP synthase [candidate division BRC1 bacterium HGW-BRC1-1]